MITLNGETMTHHYLLAALWATTDWTNGDRPLDDTHDTEDIANPEVAGEDCEAFLADNKTDLQTCIDQYGATWEQHGRDFLLTRDGHGTGFWDRGYGAIGKRLTDACRPYGDSGLYVGDDGKVWIA